MRENDGERLRSFGYVEKRKNGCLIKKIDEI